MAQKNLGHARKSEMIGKKKTLNTALATAGGLALCLLLTRCSPNAPNVSKEFLRLHRSAGASAANSNSSSGADMGSEFSSVAKAAEPAEPRITTPMTLWLDEESYSRKLRSLPETAPRAQIDSFEITSLLALDQFKQTGKLDIEVPGGSIGNATVVIALEDTHDPGDTSEDIPLVVKSLSENKWRISFDTNLKTKGAHDRIERITAVTLVFEEKEREPAKLATNPIPGPAH